MASTYTSILGLTKQGIGENASTWGNILNDNLIELLDSAITGKTVVSVVGTGDYTLSNTQGSVNEARSAIIELSGIASANRNIVVPGKTKLYVLIGSFSGSFTMTFKTSSSSSTVTLAPGQKKYVYCDGVDVFDLFDGSLYTTKANNLSDLANVTTARTNLGLGNAALKNVGTSTGNVLEFVSAAKLPALDGSLLTGILPTGTGPIPYCGTAAPSGWLFCFGQAVSRSTYADLFSVLGTAFGSGDGSTTFNLPDMRGRVPVGKDNMGGSAANRVTTALSFDGTVLGGSGGTQAVTLTISNMAEHTHMPTFTQGYNTDSGARGGVSKAGTGFSDSTSKVGPVANTDGTSVAGGVGQAHLNMQPSLVVNYIIKT